MFSPVLDFVMCCIAEILLVFFKLRFLKNFEIEISMFSEPLFYHGGCCEKNDLAVRTTEILQILS